MSLTGGPRSRQIARPENGFWCEVGNWKKQVRIALLAMTAALAAAFGSWFLATGGQTNPPAAPAAPVAPPLESKPVATTPVAPPPVEEAPKAQADAPTDPQKLAALQDALRQAPEYDAFFTRLRSLYPADYDSAAKQALAQPIETHDNSADLFLTQAVQVLRQNRGLMGARAGAEALDRLFDQHRAVLQQLAATDPALCVDFLNGAPAERFVAFAGAHRALMGAEALAGLDAIDDGTHKKIDREAPTTQDFDDLEKALLAKGMDRAAVAQLLDGKTPEPPLSDAQQCQNGLTYLDSMKALPDLQRLRLYALALEVMAHE
jgi:hypothetical protein